MKKILLLLLIAGFSSAFAQETGMKFEHGLTWAEVKAKAKAEKKYIFVDAFTTWCGPCKYMAKNIFPLKEVGDFYNANYINLKVQLDTTKTDDEEVKKWYKDAHDIMVTYQVNVFPTYLILSPDGELVHRAIGSSDAAAFLKKGKDGINPEKQYYVQKKNYLAGKRDTALLKFLAFGSLNAMDNEFGKGVIKEYLTSQPNLYTRENMTLLANSTSDVTDMGFKIFRDQGTLVDSLMYPGTSKRVLRSIAMNKIVVPAVRKRGQVVTDADWTALRQKLNENFGSISSEIVATERIAYFQRQKNWPAFRDEINAFLGSSANSLVSAQLNDYAWSIFQNCEDQKCIESALAWSRKSVDSQKDPMFMDTYANLLYKAGKKTEAIKVQEEAIKLAKDPASYQATLDKMKKGEKTW
jgi:thiol-disulfide isomerase/thioredoxin